MQARCIRQEPCPPGSSELQVSRPPNTTVRDQLSDAADCSSCDHSQDYAASAAFGTAVARGHSVVTSSERESEPLLAENEDRFCMYPIRFAHPAHRFPAKLQAQCIAMLFEVSMGLFCMLFDRPCTAQLLRGGGDCMLGLAMPSGAIGLQVPLLWQVSWPMGDVQEGSRQLLDGGGSRPVTGYAGLGQAHR